VNQVSYYLSNFSEKISLIIGIVIHRYSPPQICGGKVKSMADYPDFVLKTNGIPFLF